MCKLFLISGLMLILLAACGPVATAPATAPAQPLEPTATREPLAAALDAARQALAEQLNLAVEAIKVEKVEARDWPDACLGLPGPDEACAEVITPGFQVVLSVEGKTYEYRTDMTGNIVRMAPATEEIPPAAVAARQVLMQQKRLSVEDVNVVDVEEVDWPDGCLGVAVEGMMCTMVITPGYRVTLEAGGQLYVFHTNSDGSNIVLAEAPPPQTGAALLTWRGETPCQEAQISERGVAFGLCGAAAMDGKFAQPERAEQLQYFLKTYHAFTADTKAGKVIFNGSGQQEATVSEQRAIAEWARLVALEAAGGRGGASYGLALAWHREGGIAGFCDDLTIYVTGEAIASSCKGQQPHTLGQAFLDARQLEQVFTWVDTFQVTEIQIADPAMADAMLTRLLLNGQGNKQMSEKEKQAILDFAASLYVTLGK